MVWFHVILVRWVLILKCEHLEIQESFEKASLLAWKKDRRKSFRSHSGTLWLLQMLWIELQFLLIFCQCLLPESARMIWKTCHINFLFEIMLFQVVVSNIFNFHPYLGRWSNLTNIFPDGLKPPTSPTSILYQSAQRLNDDSNLLGFALASAVREDICLSVVRRVMWKMTIFSSPHNLCIPKSLWRPPSAFHCKVRDLCPIPKKIGWQLFFWLLVRVDSFG